MATWNNAGLLERFFMYLGRGNGGTFGPDELWTEARALSWLADAQEQVYTVLASRGAAHALVNAPVQLTTADGGVTYTFPDGAYPFGMVELYAQESNGRPLVVSLFNDTQRDGFVIEGDRIRMAGGRAQTFANGPYARYVGMAPRISATQEVLLKPDSARELILYRALVLAAEVSNGELDPAPWERKYADAETRWLTTFATQYAMQTQSAIDNTGRAWWQDIPALNG